jgi:ribose transport system permease protein
MTRRSLYPFLLNNAPAALFAVVIVVFGALSPAFLEPGNLKNILVQTASTGILAVGMTLVLLTAGVDLSVGSAMFVSAAVGGKLILGGWPFLPVLLVMILTEVLFGAVNAFFIARLKIMAFVVTLATLYFGRGLGLWITETRAMNLPEAFYELGSASLLGVPVPILIFGLVAVPAHLVLDRTPFGRQIYALGQDREAAAKAGLRVTRLETAVYVLCGSCAAVAGIVSLSQAPAVSPAFGNQREFAAIAAAVLGGTSLFGGKGKVLPGTVLGAILIQTVENGLNILNVNAYLYPLITSGIIFVAVLIDTARSGWLARLGRRKVFVEPATKRGGGVLPAKGPSL